MRIDEVSGVDGFLQLGPLWEDFCRAEGCDSFFLSHSWFCCCLSGIAQGITPLVLLVREGSAVAGIVPLLLQRATWRIFPARLLSLMQNQDSPFVDMLISRSHAGAVVTILIDYGDLEILGVLV